MVSTRSLTGFFASMALLAAPVAAEAFVGLGVQAGYGSVEAELQVPGGYFLDVGIPWFVAVQDGRTSGMTPSLPLGAKVGTQFSLGPLSLRAGPRFIYAPRRGPNDQDLTRTLGFADVGARIELPTGFVLGADAALLGFEKEKGSDAEFLGSKGALPFSQVYIGWMMSI